MVIRESCESALSFVYLSHQTDRARKLIKHSPFSIGLRETQHGKVRTIIAFLFSVLFTLQGYSDELALEGLLRGRVTDAATGEALPGATVFAQKLSFGEISDTRGYFSVALPSGSHLIEVSFLGIQHPDTDYRIAHPIQPPHCHRTPKSGFERSSCAG